MRAENNKVELTGTIITEPEFNHEVFGEGFYNMHLQVCLLYTSPSPRDCS